MKGNHASFRLPRPQLEYMGVNSHRTTTKSTSGTSQKNRGLDSTHEFFSTTRACGMHGWQAVFEAFEADWIITCLRVSPCVYVLSDRGFVVCVFFWHKRPCFSVMFLLLINACTKMLFIWFHHYGHLLSKLWHDGHVKSNLPSNLKLS